MGGFSSPFRFQSEAEAADRLAREEQRKRQEEAARAQARSEAEQRDLQARMASQRQEFVRRAVDIATPHVIADQTLKFTDRIQNEVVKPAQISEFVRRATTHVNEVLNKRGTATPTPEVVRPLTSSDSGYTGITPSGVAGPSRIQPGMEYDPTTGVTRSIDPRIPVGTESGGFLQPMIPASRNPLRKIPVVGGELARVTSGLTSPFAIETAGVGALLAPVATVAGIGGTAAGGLAGQGLEAAGVPVVNTPIGRIGPRSVLETVGGLYGGPGRKIGRTGIVEDAIPERGLGPGTFPGPEPGQQYFGPDVPPIETTGARTPAEKLRKALEPIPDIRTQYEELKSAEIGRRAGQVEDIMRTASPEDVRSQAFGAMRGALPQPEIRAPVHNLSGDDISELTQAIQDSTVIRPLEKLRAISALDDVVNLGAIDAETGRRIIPVPNELRQLEKVFPGVTEQMNARRASEQAMRMSGKAGPGVSPDWGPVPAEPKIPEVALPGMTGPTEKFPKGWAATVGENLQAVPGISMSTKASFDMGTRFRQAMVLGWSHPRQWLSNWRPTANALFSERSAQETMAKVRANPWATALHGPNKGLGFTDLGGHLYEWADTTLGNERVAGFTGMNDSFLARMVRKIPGIRGSERAFAVDLNKQGVEVYAAEAQKMWDIGIRDTKQYKELVEVINHARGYGAFNVGQVTQGVNAFFSGRNLVAKFQVVMDPFVRSGGLTSPSARQLAAKNLVGMVAGDLSLIGFLGAVGAATGIGSVEVNPLKPGGDWLKFRIGNTRIDPWGGFLPMARLITRMGAVTLTETGVKDTGYDAADIKRQLGTFFENKESPVFRLFSDIAGLSEPFGGQPRKLLSTKTLIDLYLPFLAEDVWDAVKNTDWAMGPAIVPFAATGIGVQSYQPTPAQIVWTLPEYKGLTAGEASDIWAFLGRVSDYRGQQVIEHGRADSEDTIINKLAAKEGMDNMTIQWARALNRGDQKRMPQFLDYLVAHVGELKDRYPSLYDSRDVQERLYQASGSK